MPLSVIVPCYNAARFVGEAITSILNQSCLPEEIVIVDDGSTDDSVAQIGRFEGQVRLLRQANAGAAAARNAGLAATCGQLVAFLDADDLWPPDSLSSRLGAMERSRADIVFGAVRELVDTGSADTLLGPPVEGRMAGSMIVRRGVFDQLGDFDESLRSAEVVDFASRAQLRGFSSESVADVVLHRRVHGANLMLRHSGACEDVLRVLRRTIERKRGRAIS